MSADFRDGQEGGGSSPRRGLQLWRLLWRGKSVILASLLLGLVPTILILQQATPLYTSEAVVVIEAPETSASMLDHAQYRPILTEATVQTESEVLGSSKLSRRVIDKLKLWDDPEFNRALRPPQLMETILGWVNPMAWLAEVVTQKEGQDLSPGGREEVRRARIAAIFSGRLRITAHRRSYAISIEFTSENREKAALIANTIADLYMLDRLEAGFEETRQVTGWLGERLDKLRNDVSVAEQAVETQRAAHGLRRQGEHNVTVTDQQLTEINSRLVIARSELAQKQARLSQVQALLKSRGSSDTSYDVLQSQLIQRLREQEAILMRQLSEAGKTYGDRHPQIIGYKADLAELQHKINQEIERIAVSVANEVEVAAAGTRTMETELERLRHTDNSTGGEEVRLRELERDAEVSRTLYESFLSRFKHDTEQERIQRANARIVSPAVIPARPSKPRKVEILLLVIVSSLTIGGGLVLLLDRLDNSLRSADEVEDLIGMPTLAMVPLVKGRKSAPEEEVLAHPHSTLTDSLRGLRTVLDMPSDGPSGPVTLITSSLPKEGKSFVALGLARMAAKTGQRVLLVDADLHRPTQHKMQGVEGKRGLVQVLLGQAELDEVLVRDERSGMDLLPAGELPANTAEILSSPRLGPLIAELSRRWDRVILDTPPTLVVSDTRLLVRLADQVVYLVKWNGTPRETVRNGVKSLSEAGANLTGIVLSQVDIRKHAGYYYGDYGQYYGRYTGYSSK